MNIYITKENEEFLRNLGEPMSGLINKLLNDYRAGKGPDLFPPPVGTPSPKTTTAPTTTLPGDFTLVSNTKPKLPPIKGVSVGFCKHNYAKGMCKYGCK